DAAVGTLLESCDSFSGTRSTVCLFSVTLPLEAARRTSVYPWVGVMSFDPQLDSTGVLRYANDQKWRLNRLVVKGQAARYATGSPTWLALGGIADRPDTVVSDEIRAWRRAYKKTLDESLDALARFSPRPVTLVIFGSPDERVKVVVEAMDDRF